MNDLKFHKKPVPEYFIALEEQRKQKADVESKLDCHYFHNQPEGVALCGLNEMRPCIYEVGGMFCKEYNENLEERR